MTEKIFETREVACIGTRQGQKGPIVGLVLAEVADADAKAAVYWPVAVLKKYGMTTPGAVYQIEVALDEDGTIGTIKGVAKYMRRHRDDAAVAVWEAKTQAVMMEERTKKAEAKMKADTKLDALFDPIAEVLAKLAWQDQAAFENYMVARVRYLARKKG